MIILDFKKRNVNPKSLSARVEAMALRAITERDLYGLEDILKRVDKENLSSQKLFKAALEAGSKEIFMLLLKYSIAPKENQKEIFQEAYKKFLKDSDMKALAAKETLRPYILQAAAAEARPDLLSELIEKYPQNRTEAVISAAEEANFENLLLFLQKGWIDKLNIHPVLTATTKKAEGKDFISFYEIVKDFFPEVKLETSCVTSLLNSNQSVYEAIKDKVDAKKVAIDLLKLDQLPLAGQVIQDLKVKITELDIRRILKEQASTTNKRAYAK